ncbi:hypothetical protein ACFWUU_02340 [Kribbella sp. NPDC058693]|uniref:hypothetical protein n=1 Tax=Kribbella sp. NPDC058693 TaxID=3346602 RepID=UPI0036613971
MNHSDVWGREWDFLAVDETGQVAVLSTAGYGPIPAAVLADRENVEHAIEDLARMPVTTTAVPADPDRPGNYSDWYDVSARGFYTFDWRVWHGPYELIATPSDPAQIEHLPDVLRTAANLLRIPQLFAELSSLQLVLQP